MASKLSWKWANRGNQFTLRIYRWPNSQWLVGIYLKPLVRMLATSSSWHEVPRAKNTGKFRRLSVSASCLGGSGAKWVENFSHLFCFVRFLLRYMVTTPITDIPTNITIMDIATTNPATIIIIIIITDIAMILKTNILMNILLENINKKQIPRNQAVILRPKNLLPLKPQTENGQNGFRR